MTAWGDLPHEMRGERIDADTMERLLRGRLTPDDAPPGYSDVASILLTAASPAEPGEVAMELRHVTAARAILAERAAGRRPARKVLAAAIVAGALMILPGLAAANVLPDPAQHAVSSVLEKVGISVPAGSEEHPSDPGGHPASTGSEISRIATTTDATGVAKGAEISSVASGGKSQAGQHGKASDAPRGAPPQEPGSRGQSGQSQSGEGGQSGQSQSGESGQSGDAMTNHGPSNARSEHASPKAGVAPTHP
jgi:hypothetical protein